MEGTSLNAGFPEPWVKGQRTVIRPWWPSRWKDWSLAAPEGWKKTHIAMAAIPTGGLILWVPWLPNHPGRPWMDASDTLTLQHHHWGGCSDQWVLVLVDIWIGKQECEWVKAALFKNKPTFFAWKVCYRSTTIMEQRSLHSNWHLLTSEPLHAFLLT